jgi:uncharacterized GH25 family protein
MRRIGSVLVLVLLASATAFAHDLWLMPEAPALSVGIPVKLKAVLGHNFPAGSYQPKAGHLKIEARMPGGEKMPVPFAPSGFYQVAQFTPRETGQCVLTADYTSYLASTPDGPIYLPKDKIAGKPYKYCNFVSQCAKVVLGKGEAALEPAGMNIELVPQKDPSALGVGDLLPVRVLWKGKALAPSSGAEVEVKAVYAGFQADEDTFAFLGRANGEGVSRIRITAPGWWMAMVEHRVPAADKTKADEEIYIGTLVFHVSPDTGAKHARR